MTPLVGMFVPVSLRRVVVVTLTFGRLNWSNAKAFGNRVLNLLVTLLLILQ